uniref:Integrase catalytic domain-containing protein n=1 Tax=Cannabis sativa TaxID=3483 RepID=A0A803Q3J9_CANSA
MASKDTDTSARSDTPEAPIPAEAEVPPFFPNNNLLPLNLRLDRSNYTYWRTLVLAAVRAYNFDGFLLGTNPTPPQLTAGNVPNSAYHQWLRLDQFLMHWMMNSITEPMLGYVINCRTSSEIWTVFAQLFATTSRARLLQIRGLLQSTKKGSSTVDDYILKMKGYADHLAAAGQAISDEDLALYILGGLGSEYESIVVSLTSRSEPLTLQELQFMLHSHEVRLQQLSAIALQNVQANLANLSLNNGNRGGRGYRGAYRGGRGQSTNRGGRGNRPTCQLCGRPGHTVQKCYHRFDITFTGTQTNTGSNSNSPSENYQANISESAITEESTGTWYLDTGATNHLTVDAQQLTTSADYKGKAKVVVGNGASIPILHVGSNSISTHSPNKSLLLKDILHVPSITQNLLSISQFTKDNNVVLQFDSVCCLIKGKTTKQVLLRGSLSNGLYKLEVPTQSIAVQEPHQPRHKTAHCNTSVFNCTTTSNPVFDKNRISSTWHCRLGHPAKPNLVQVLAQVCPQIRCKEVDFCDACQLGKMHQFTFKPTANKTVSPFEIIHTDIWGPSFYTSRDGYKYYLSCVDDFTRFVWIYPMQSKAEVTVLFTHFQNLVERMFDTKIKSVQTDLGKKFSPLYKHFHELGIQVRQSCAHTHQQQGRVERKHRHVVDMGLTLLAQAQMPLHFWWEAYASAAYLINRLPTPILGNVSPYEKLYNHKPDYNLLKVFGCSCFPLLTPYNTHKVAFRSSKCLFLGYNSTQKGYRCLHPNGRVYVARSVKFNEAEFPYRELFTQKSNTTSPPVIIDGNNFSLLNFNSRQFNTCPQTRQNNDNPATTSESTSPP